MDQSESSRFLWIDVTQSSSAKKYSPAKAHVLREYHRKAREKMTSQAADKSAIDKPPESHETVPDFKSFKTQFRLNNSKQPKTSKQRGDEQNSIVKGPITVSSQSSQGVEAEISLQVQENILSLCSLLIAPLDDSTNRHEGNQHFAEQMDYFCHSFLALVYPFQGSFWFGEWISLAMAQPTLTGALLALIPEHRSPPIGADSSIYANSTSSYRSRAVNMLNHTVDTTGRCARNDIIVSQAALICIESVRQHNSIAEAHMRGFLSLINGLGGLDALNHADLSSIFLSSSKFALATNTRPPISITNKWKADLITLEHLPTYAQNPPLDLQGLGNRFFDNDITMLFSTSMLQSLHRYCGLIVYVEMAKRNATIADILDDDVVIALEHEFLTLFHDEVLSSSPIQQCCILALLVYNETNLRKCCIFEYIDGMVANLQALLSQNMEACEILCPDLLVWMLWVGSFASRWHPRHASWFNERLGAVTTAGGVQNWDQMKGILRHFFFVDRPFELVNQPGQPVAWGCSDMSPSAYPQL